ncbi:contactin-associated protein 1-like isoform X2 [Montipora foliosa]|uniref:contactin-associated protein 1-like isoform X2 n=1 Tax=Montipora foliosa TaxID=591990 RepID=UPI0035F1D6D6
MQTGHFLFGHVLYTAVVSDEFQCHLKCLGSSKCKSFNVHPAESGGSGRICQLNNETRETKPSDFKKKKGSHYYGPVKISCVDVSTHKSWHQKNVNECERKTHSCDQHAKCTNELGAYMCSCDRYIGEGYKCRQRVLKSCSDVRKFVGSASGNFVIDPDGVGGLAPFTVYCDMTDKNGIGVTVISHDSERRTHVQGCEAAGCYSRDVHYIGASLSQLAMLTTVSSNCEQFIKYECHGSSFWFSGPYGFWVSRESRKMAYWGGASPGSAKCACGMTGSCASRSQVCNCDNNDLVWREDSGLLADKTNLPVKQLRFGDTGNAGEQGYHTLGKFKCYGMA